MNPKNPCPEQNTATNEQGARRPHATSARRRHAASFSDAVIAAYIHDLRHSSAQREDEAAA